MSIDKDVSKDMTLRYIFNNNVMFTKTGYTLILDKGLYLNIFMIIICI